MDPLLTARPFMAFGLSHGVVIVVLAVVAAALVVLGRRYRDTSTELLLSRAIAVVFAAFLVPVEVYWLLPGQEGMIHSLPLSLCDLAAMATLWALWSHSSTAFALTYYWGLTLTSQAFLSPELNGPDFPSLQFLSFFGMHCLVLWAAIYLTWGAGMRPDWRSYRIALLVTVGWVAVMLVFNYVAGTNYGFVNAKPPTSSVLDVLGPWPWYLLAGLVLIATIWALITYPWVRRTQSAESRPVESPRSAR
ncbi:MAG TPA: TIGR02206 family membrane protein [Pseudonocardiaceae bacterium]|nr:TIGR02206 family membrane protein [Pseudonocardiaceae bacterium]